MRRAWERTTGEQVDYLQILDDAVVIGRHRGSPHTDEATSASFADVLAGRFHDEIERIHGRAVLDEVLAAIRG